MIYIEGTDGVGKTATIEELKKYGIICSDRNKEIISKNMVFSVSIEERAKIYSEYLKKSDDIVIFLVNNDEEEMMRRILSRKIIDEYDLETNKFNKLYLETYKYMLNKNLLYNKMFLVDCTNLDLASQVQKVRKVLENA